MRSILPAAVAVGDAAGNWVSMGRRGEGSYSYPGIYKGGDHQVVQELSADDFSRNETEVTAQDQREARAGLEDLLNQSISIRRALCTTAAKSFVY